jgi:hypothetical protein
MTKVDKIVTKYKCKINALTTQFYTIPISPQCNHHALKGQNPSAEGTALGNEAQNKTRHGWAKALIPHSSFLISNSSSLIH